jgi:hypothetical protein
VGFKSRKVYESPRGTKNNKSRLVSYGNMILLDPVALMPPPLMIPYIGGFRRQD